MEIQIETEMTWELYNDNLKNLKRSDDIPIIKVNIPLCFILDFYIPIKIAEPIGNRKFKYNDDYYVLSDKDIKNIISASIGKGGKYFYDITNACEVESIVYDFKKSFIEIICTAVYVGTIDEDKELSESYIPGEQLDIACLSLSEWINSRALNYIYDKAYQSKNNYFIN
jgi:hypothetical protein